MDSVEDCHDWELVPMGDRGDERFDIVPVFSLRVCGLFVGHSVRQGLDFTCKL